MSKFETGRRFPKKRIINQDFVTDREGLSKIANRRRRHANELKDAIAPFGGLMFDRTSNAVLDLQAKRRGVSKTLLASDILNCWILFATDYSQQLFKECLPQRARAADVPERYPGYLASLGFAPAMDVEAPVPPPSTPMISVINDERPLPPPKYVPGATLLEQAAYVEPVSRCYCGNASVNGTPFCAPHIPPKPVAKVALPQDTAMPLDVETPPEVPALAAYGGPGAGVFDAEAHARVAGPVGLGNAAQSYDLGFTPRKF